MNNDNFVNDYQYKNDQGNLKKKNNKDLVNMAYMKMMI